MKSNAGGSDHGLQEIALDQRHAVGDAQPGRVVAGDGQCRGADVDGGDLGFGDVAGRRDTDDAAAGAHVGDCHGRIARFAGLVQIQQGEHQQLGLGRGMSTSGVTRKSSE